jgi:putative methyltransferase (TIGR04325 family)
MSRESGIRSFARSVMPPVLLDFARGSVGRFMNQVQFSGHFLSWDEAARASSGYDEDCILQTTIEAARKVINGEMAFERDSVPFPEMQYHFPLLWALTRATVRYQRLHVIDFGGALGSSYFQSRHMLDTCEVLKWAIVEQPSHVTVGNKEFANSELSFHRSLDSACKDTAYDVLLLSGVIQYLPDPFAFLGHVLGRRIPSIIVDRTPFMTNGIARLTVQHVPKRIYPASYPAWFLSEQELLAAFTQQYERIATWPALDKHHPQGGRAEYKGFLFELKKESKPSAP